jgi:hypothetical protein
VTSQAATSPAGPVLGPAAPTYTDLIWATGCSQAELASPAATATSRQAVLEAEAATYIAAAHLGLDEMTAGQYQAELAASAADGPAMEWGDQPTMADWSLAATEPEAGL